ncbi:hypothetical protein Poli38472_012821 [Pythium oligandrum]|uniref:Exocyst complex component 8 n=1 Tax=Pythium oligandrum TaxID=41045 RepID=A0A8K1FKH5_PYTOL|nr:hypothetical protein Poli38472_012821 [Pythium oligandrum]|eukprot:TMW64199.1 hypothetical protein Poli38472_012821 [Pythium oligandrum]
MVSAAEARRAALHEGALEKRRRTGGWKKKYFVLTPTQFCYFDSTEASDARSTLPTVEILSVEPNESDNHHRGLVINLYRKKKEYRALTTEERDVWLHALDNVAAFKRDGTKNTPLTVNPADGESEDPAVPREQSSSSISTATVTVARDTSSSALVLSPNTAVDLPKLVEMMKKTFSKQVQTSKSFSARDVIEFVQAQVSTTTDQALDIGQQLIDSKFIVPLKSHIFEDDGSRFKFYDAVSQKQPKNHLAMRSQSIQDLMGTAHFDATKYAEDFLRKHASDKIEKHCTQLVSQKERTIEALKEEISANYTSFIRASAETKTMENSVSQLKMLVLDCKRSIQALKNIALDTTPAKKESPSFEIAEKKAAEKAKSRELDGFVHDLEVSLNEHAYASFTSQVLLYKQRLQQNGAAYATPEQQARVDRLVQQFTGNLVEEFNASMQTSERMHKKEDHLKYLIQLGEASFATDMCLQNYSVRIALQLRHVPSYGNALNYVINLSRTFFTSLLVCYEDFEHSFRGQKHSHFISLTVWISAQLERFASEILGHIFSNDLQASSTPAQQAQSCSTAIEFAEYKNVTKFVTSALRYVFYGSRQLELAGLPTAHCLAPHLVKGILSFMGSYSASIRVTSREEVKRERWEMLKRTIRDAEKKEDREIILTQSARSFYSMIQQFIRDMQRVLNPSCATSYVAEVHEAVVDTSDALLLRYTSEILAYLENLKLSSVLRLKQLVGLLTNVAYVQDDCVARATLILQEFVSKAALQNRSIDTQNQKLWRKLVVLGIQRCAQSLMKMSIGWQDLDLSEEALPDLSSGKTLFVATLLRELNDISNDQLEKLLRKYRRNSDEADDENDDNEDQVILATMVLEGMLVEMMQDEQWWQQLRKSNGKEKRIGFGGVNRFVAELRVLTESSQSSKVIEEVSSVLVRKLSETFLQCHPEKKDALAPETWTKDYIKMCLAQAEAAVANKGSS